MDEMNDEDKAKMQAYLQSLNQPPSKIQQMASDTDKAMEIASRSPLSNTTPEEQQFAQEQLGPLQGLLSGGGGVMGTVGAAENEAGQAVKPAFQNIQKVLGVGNVQAPVQNAAQAVQVQNALQQTGQVLPGKFGRVLNIYGK